MDDIGLARFARDAFVRRVGEAERALEHVALVVGQVTVSQALQLDKALFRGFRRVKLPHLGGTRRHRKRFLGRVRAPEHDIINRLLFGRRLERLAEHYLVIAAVAAVGAHVSPPFP